MNKFIEFFEGFELLIVGTIMFFIGLVVGVHLTVHVAKIDPTYFQEHIINGN